jgi:DNA topoisomerase-2
MPIWSLTEERVTKLLKEKNAKENELNELLKKSAKDLWNADLDAFTDEWNRTLEKDDEIANKEKNRVAKTKQAKGIKGGKPKKGDDDDYLDYNHRR